MSEQLTQEQVKKLSEAKVLIEKQKWNNASSLLESLYEECMQDDINFLLVESLYMDHQYKSAYDYAIDNMTQYLNSLKLYKLMVNVCLESRHVIKAHQFSLMTDQIEWRKSANTVIEKYENDISENLSKTNQEIFRQFYHLGDEVFIEQKRRVEMAEQLTLPQYLTGVKFLLRDPFTHPLIRSSLLQSLLELNETGPIKFYWIDNKEHTVNLSVLDRLEDQNFYKKVMNYLDEKVGNSDPLAFSMISSEFKLEMMISYPLSQSIMPNYHDWIDVMIQKYHGDVIDSKYHSVEEWQKKINEIIENLVS